MFPDVHIPSFDNLITVIEFLAKMRAFDLKSVAVFAQSLLWGAGNE